MCSVVNCISCLVREHNDVAAMPSIPTGLGKKTELEAGDAVDGGTETAPETTAADSTDWRGAWHYYDVSVHDAADK